MRVSAVAQADPPQITLSWPAAAAAERCWVYRKLRDDSAWDKIVVLSTNATNYVDPGVSAGVAYEYQVFRYAGGISSFGYICTGAAVPFTEYRGKVILLVDNTLSLCLSNELARLGQDLIGDGWTVLRHDVGRMAVAAAETSSNVWKARMAEVASVKALIKSDYGADPTGVKAVFILGRVPVPYSGDLAPDGHSNHRGAWPADAYYGDVTGSWTDATVSNTVASDARNRNLIGDGKFDQTTIPAKLALQVGRVDFANLPTFAVGETELLRRYLNKDHNFRHGVTQVVRRGLIDDHFGVYTGEAYAANGWRDFAAFFGPAGTAGAEWLTTLSSQSCLWGYGCGGGTYTSCSGVASTGNYLTNDPQVVFASYFGSYFGDWDSPDNFLRAALATPTYTLTSAWVGRPFWFFHHMGLGETVGYSARVSQNDDGTLYSGSEHRRMVHIALLGDPTLRLHIVAPPTSLTGTQNCSGGVDLTWAPSTDSVAGYHVYRAATAAGPFTRLNGSLLLGTDFTDSVSGTNVYMVRAVKLELSASGSYSNASQGLFLNFTPAPPLPVLTITAQSQTKAFGAPLPELTAQYRGFINGDTPASLACLPSLTTSATSSSPPGDYPIYASGASSTNYTFSYVAGTLTVVRAVTTGKIQSSANPSPSGATVTFAFALEAIPPGAGTPTGPVQFAVDGVDFFPAATLSNGIATCATSALEHGTHWVTATYAGDGNFAGTSNLLASQVVNIPPLAGTDFIECDPGTSARILLTTLLEHAFDADADTVSFLYADSTSVRGGTVVSDGTWLAYTPPSGLTDTDLFTYALTDGWGPPVAGTIFVLIRMDPGPPPDLTLIHLGNGSFEIHGDGVPGRVYRLEFAPGADGSGWQRLGNATADTNGSFLYIDPDVTTQRFYRAVYP